MKCQNCGAEIGNSKYCEFCGTQVTLGALREQEQINKQGCPKCGSTNIQFKRENQGEVRGKKSRQIIHRTVGFCKDCGHTWYPDTDTQPKKRKTWLWVLGWIFIFPVPLTILMLRNRDMKPALKYGIIAAGWIVYLLIGIGGNSSDKSDASAGGDMSATVAPTEISEQISAPEETTESKAVEELENSVPVSTPEAVVESEVSFDKGNQEDENETLNSEPPASFESVLPAFEQGIKEIYGENCEVKLSDNIINVNFWYDGIITEATQAINGNEEMLSTWNALVESITETQKNLQQVVRNSGYDDEIVVLNLLNDLNKENVLLVITQETVMLDYVNNINLLGIG